MVRDKVRELLLRDFHGKARLIEKLSDEEDFVKKNLFDSFEIIKIISMIESEFKVTIAVEDLANERLNSLAGIEAFLLSKNAA